MAPSIIAASCCSSVCWSPCSSTGGTTAGLPHRDFVVTVTAWIAGYATPPERGSVRRFLIHLLRARYPRCAVAEAARADARDSLHRPFDRSRRSLGYLNAAGLTEADGRPINLRRGLIVDAVATFPSVSQGRRPERRVESIAGIRMGRAPVGHRSQRPRVSCRASSWRHSPPPFPASPRRPC